MPMGSLLVGLRRIEPEACTPFISLPPPVLRDLSLSAQAGRFFSFFLPVCIFAAAPRVRLLLPRWYVCVYDAMHGAPCLWI